jgi:uncharacterized protein with NRDE domain
MCTLILLRRPGHDWPVIIAANRDEMIDRPARPPARHWPDRPEVVAGLDELAGGSWLGLNDHGVVAGILNRFGTLGPAPGQRSRGELVLEALDHADALAAALALGEINPRAYRSFNMIIADNRDAFWLRHADMSGTLPVEVRPIAAGLSMIAAGDIDETETPRLVRYRPRFAAAAAPDPGSADWAAWEALLADDQSAAADGPMSALRFVTEGGFATVSSALIALPGLDRGEVEPVFRYRTWQPVAGPWRAILA